MKSHFNTIVLFINIGFPFVCHLMNVLEYTFSLHFASMFLCLASRCLSSFSFDLKNWFVEIKKKSDACADIEFYNWASYAFIPHNLFKLCLFVLNFRFWVSRQRLLFGIILRSHGYVLILRLKCLPSRSGDIWRIYGWFLTLN